MIAPDLEAIRKRAVTLSAFFDEYLESVKPSEVHETVADGGEWIEKPTGDLVCYACAEDPSECGETCLRLMAADASMSTHDVPALCDEVEQLRAENAKLREVAQRAIQKNPLIARTNSDPEDEKSDMVCSCCGGDPEVTTPTDCLRTFAEMVLANGWAGGGE